ncbi:2-hydroxyglutaryl-CoA dehydratase [Pajaroellobacter abortibovis]|uniref:2-hydroxyglutaryl-CoA dehydratase n=1 Tax=Pajaroellobacter abortibovis TaxID=1882918 RepID=A0A1L6MWP7_9BACT|nr:2-hydroxyglutaryl-CoA dehydratase [Pajaroellobacter abortibovis]APR99884.1 2-hydroxyglutaryl-CoA dehydratase [Pajaroellobacter abortibovis]
METELLNGNSRKRVLPFLQMSDIEAELKDFESEERKRLGIEEKVVDHWVEKMANLTFTKSERSTITLLVGGLTMAHDYFVEGGLRGVGYRVQMLDMPDTAALQYGREFGNRGQCNPTYFTVGNLVKFLCTLRDKRHIKTEDIIKNYVFLTAGACGPCRFGMYVTEYRKALRDAGFDGFRVVIFQQTGGLKQATGEASGLELNPTFFSAIVKALLVGDIINALGYRIRPYEIHSGDTDKAIEKAKAIVYQAMVKRKSVLRALWKSRLLFSSIPVDRTRVKPKVSIIGEFWAMTTEGDGNYQLQRFLESEGAEADIQLVTAWLLYMVWEAQHDTEERKHLRGSDRSKYGLGELTNDPFGIAKKLYALHGADYAIRILFQIFAHVGGLHGYKLPNMKEIAEISHQYYDNDIRGGEGHMEVGKLIMNVTKSKSHMTLSVKPFGCMPSAGVSDGVQSAIIEKFPGTIFCPVETSGDGRVNFYSRIQMYLFKARQAAVEEYDRALAKEGISKDQIRQFLEKKQRYASPLYKAPHVYAGSSADLVAKVAPLLTQSRWQRTKRWVRTVRGTSARLMENSPRKVWNWLNHAYRSIPEVAGWVREDVMMMKEYYQDWRGRKKTAHQVSAG